MTSMYGATNTSASTNSQKNPCGPCCATSPRVSSPTNAQTVKPTMSSRRSDLISLLFSARARAVVCSATAAMRSSYGLGDALPGLGEDFTENSHDFCEFLRTRNEGRGDLDDRVAAIVCTADEAVLEERRREEPAQERLRLLVAEGLARLLVLDELERPEVAGTAQVADDVEVEKRRELGAERLLLLGDVLDDALALHDL